MGLDGRVVEVDITVEVEVEDEVDGTGMGGCAEGGTGKGADTRKLVPIQKDNWASVCSGCSGGLLRYWRKEVSNSSSEATL